MPITRRSKEHIIREWWNMWSHYADTPGDGTSRVNTYKILEDSLNLKDTRVYDTIEEDGKEKRVGNKSRIIKML